ncbi:type II secretion system secretin GspD [Azotobacter chroococcum]|uniref:type II secretion system secretin GspD n=1 Tax=Azotobacter chroococcum TaxID=353 RepID=UPI001A954874|nr:type II secretion system secretin GspD [Azotobacter chroococcum]
MASLLFTSWLLACPAGADDYSLDMRDTDISEFIASIGKLTGKTIVMDPRVKGKVSISTPKSVTKEELYEIFLVQLGVNGYSVINVGKDILKVIPQQGAKLEGIEVQGGNNSPTHTSERIVTRVVQVQNVDVAALVPILRPLVDNQSGIITPYPASNVILITDREANVRRLLEVIERVDKADSDDTEIIWLQNASAPEVSETLTALIREQTKGSEGSRLMPIIKADDRTNSLLIRADKANREYLRQVIGQLDSEVQTDNNTRVHYLKYAKAEDLAEVLEKISGTISEEEGKAPPESAGTNQDAIHIKAHEATNSIVMSGSPRIIRDLGQLIEQLDIRRAQVLVEAIIVEMGEDRAKEVGVQWLLADRNGSGRALAGTNFTNLGNGLNGILDATSDGEQSVAGALRNVGGLTAGVGRLSGSGLNFAVLLKALQDDTKSNILSTPSLLTLDNQAASILVGQEIPVSTGSTLSNDNDANNQFRTIERKDVGVKLLITPQINEGGAVQLQIEQEVSSVGEQVGDDGVSFNKRQIKTAVLVDNGATIVLGGLIDDDIREGGSKVPGLGSLPVVGRLFRSDVSRITRRNLMVFIRPTIIRDQEMLTSVSKAKYGFIRDRQLIDKDSAVELFPEERPAVLPEWTGLGPTSINVLPPKK